MLSFALQSNHNLNTHIITRHVQRGGGRSSGRLSSSELRTEFENRHLKCFSCPTQNASSKHSTGRDNEKMKTFIILLGVASFLSLFTSGQAKTIKAGE